MFTFIPLLILCNPFLSILSFYSILLSHCPKNNFIFHWVHRHHNCVFMHVCVRRDISIKVLGYWFWWLFIVPSLRSRRPRGFEKKALDIAFLGTPLVSLLAPVVTKDTGLIWTANFIIVACSYGFAYFIDDLDDYDDDPNQPAWLKFVYKSLDFGSGRERGARK